VWCVLGRSEGWLLASGMQSIEAVSWMHVTVCNQPHCDIKDNQTATKYIKQVELSNM
jgi:hypothetical protein